MSSCIAWAPSLAQARAPLALGAPDVTDEVRILNVTEADIRAGRFVQASERLNRRFVGKNAERARKLAEEAQSQIAYVLVVPESATAPTDVALTIDGTTIRADREVPVDPGSHELHLGSRTVAFEIAAKQHRRFQLKRPANADRKDAAKVSGAQPQSTTWRRPVAYVAMGVGGAGLLVGTIFGALSAGTRSDLKAQCPNNQCSPSAQGLLDKGKTQGTVATVAIVGGLLVAGAGITLFLLAPKNGTSRTGALAPSTRLSLSLSGTELWMKGTF
jgi:hypothetical protein